MVEDASGGETPAARTDGAVSQRPFGRAKSEAFGGAASSVRRPAIAERTPAEAADAQIGSLEEAVRRLQLARPGSGRDSPTPANDAWLAKSAELDVLQQLEAARSLLCHATRTYSATLLRDIYTTAVADGEQSRLAQLRSLAEAVELDGNAFAFKTACLDACHAAEKACRQTNSSDGDGSFGGGLRLVRSLSSKATQSSERADLSDFLGVRRTESLVGPPRSSPHSPTDFLGSRADLKKVAEVQEVSKGTPASIEKAWKDVLQQVHRIAEDRELAEVKQIEDINELDDEEEALTGEMLDELLAELLATYSSGRDTEAFAPAASAALTKQLEDAHAFMGAIFETDNLAMLHRLFTGNSGAKRLQRLDAVGALAEKLGQSRERRAADWQKDPPPAPKPAFSGGGAARRLTAAFGAAPAAPTVAAPPLALSSTRETAGKFDRPQDSGRGCTPPQLRRLPPSPGLGSSTATTPRSPGRNSDLVDGTLNPEAWMQLLGRLEHCLDQVAMLRSTAAGFVDKVKLPKAEIELLQQLEAARELMASSLRVSDRRDALRSTFGSDKVVRFRAILDSHWFVSLSHESATARVAECRRLWQSIERRLGAEALLEEDSLLNAILAARTLAELRDLGLSPDKARETKIWMAWMAQRVVLDDPALRELDFRGLALSRKDALIHTVPIFARSLSSNSHLETLLLDSCELQDEDVLALSRGLMSNKALRTLSLNHNHITPRTFGSLARCLACNTTLKTLRMGAPHPAEATSGNATANAPPWRSKPKGFLADAGGGGGGADPLVQRAREFAALLCEPKARSLRDRTAELPAAWLQELKPLSVAAPSGGSKYIETTPLPGEPQADSAALVIQRHTRRHLARKRCTNLRAAREEEAWVATSNRAAALIQSKARRHFARQDSKQLKQAAEGAQAAAERQKRSEAALTLQRQVRTWLQMRRSGRWRFAACVRVVRQRHSQWTALFDRLAAGSKYLSFEAFEDGMVEVHPRFCRAQLLTLWKVFSGRSGLAGVDFEGFVQLLEAAAAGDARVAEYADLSEDRFLALADSAEEVSEEMQLRISAAQVLQRHVRLWLADRRTGTLSFALCVQRVRQRHSQWAALFDRVAKGSKYLQFEAFFAGMVKAQPRLAKLQLYALWEVFCSRSGLEGVDFEGFAQMLEAATFGDARVAEYADLSEEDFVALGGSDLAADEVDEAQERASAALVLQKHVRRWLCDRRTGKLSFASCVRHVAKRHMQWTALFDRVAYGSKYLPFDSFAEGMVEVHPRLSKLQVFALWEGFCSLSSLEGVDFEGFVQMLEAATISDARVAEYADLAEEDFVALGEEEEGEEDDGGLFKSKESLLAAGLSGTPDTGCQHDDGFRDVVDASGTTVTMCDLCGAKLQPERRPVTHDKSLPAASTGRPDTGGHGTRVAKKVSFQDEVVAAPAEAAAEAAAKAAEAAPVGSSGAADGCSHEDGFREEYDSENNKILVCDTCGQVAEVGCNAASAATANQGIAVDAVAADSVDEPLVTRTGPLTGAETSSSGEDDDDDGGTPPLAVPAICINGMPIAPTAVPSPDAEELEKNVEEEALRLSTSKPPEGGNTPTGVAAAKDSEECRQPEPKEAASPQPDRREHSSDAAGRGAEDATDVMKAATASSEGRAAAAAADAVVAKAVAVASDATIPEGVLEKPRRRSYLEASSSEEEEEEEEEELGSKATPERRFSAPAGTIAKAIPSCGPQAEHATSGGAAAEAPAPAPRRARGSRSFSGPAGRGPFSGGAQVKGKAAPALRRSPFGSPKVPQASRP
eukprot:TRINITY_DN1769_c0_g6_i1.p1 TRINITY_DN1769_c0_g6~~TRINITY_DN1769_c0_g6_i1.p1  ORF type:complete len:1784 (-),score=490.91 TRINITY_DN1769_c0_g6_i1:574-5925(-)